MGDPTNAAVAQAVRRIRQVSLRAPIVPGPVGSVSLAVGEPSFDTPTVIVDAMAAALASGATHYCHQQGLPELRDRIGAHESRAGRTVGRSEVLVTHGGSGGLAAAILSVVNPEAVVAIEDPTYSLYADLVAMTGGIVRTFGRRPDGRLDRVGFARACDGAAMVIVCQPSNPTGAILSRDDWRYIAEAATANDSVVVSDEAYGAIVYSGYEFTSILDVPELAERGVLCQTLSKKYAMTGWRIGYLVGPEWLIGGASAVHRTFNGSVNAAVQLAAIVALDQGGVAAEEMRVAYEQRRSVMSAALSDVGALTASEPAGAFYYFCRYSDPRSSVDFAAAGRAAGVLVRPGREFGPAGEGHVRLSFATSEDVIREGVRRLAGVLEH